MTYSHGSIASLVADLGTVFAYGQTSSGKTYVSGDGARVEWRAPMFIKVTRVMGHVY